MKKLLASLMMFVALLMADSVKAQESVVNFFRSLDGQWRGSGEIVAGKYKGTRFQCNFTSLSEIVTVGLLLDGNCRMGLFSQNVKAKVAGEKNGIFSGHFNGGSGSEGMDITAGQVGADHVMLHLHRNELEGTMQAKLVSDNIMQITLSVKVFDHFIPIVGVNLQRNPANFAPNLARN